MTCPKCGTNHEAKFCPECGAAAAVHCTNCGAALNGAKFCPECGAPASGAKPAQPQAQQPQARAHYEEVTLWEGKPAGLLDQAKGKLNDLSYRITNQRIIINSGLIGKKQEEIDFKHIKDIVLNQSLTDRMAKVGDIKLVSTDPTSGSFMLKNVSDPIAVKEIIRKAWMDARANMNIVQHEHI